MVEPCDWMHLHGPKGIGAANALHEVKHCRGAESDVVGIHRIDKCATIAEKDVA